MIIEERTCPDYILKNGADRHPPRTKSSGIAEMGTDSRISAKRVEDFAGRGELIATNMAGRNKRELLAEFRALVTLRPNLLVNVRHFILSTPAKDRVTKGTQALFSQRFAELMRFDGRMWLGVRHKDHEHDEVHFVTTNIDLRGRAPSDSFLLRRVELVARQIEVEFNLTRTRGSQDSMRRSPKQSEFKAFERTGKLSYVQLIQAKVDAVLDRDLTFSQFVKRLENEAVRLTPVVSNSHEVIGTIYETEGFRVKGSRLGRGYTFEGLQKEWRGQEERKGKVLYEFERDNQAIRKRAIFLEEGVPRTTGRKERYLDGAPDKSHNGNPKQSDRAAQEDRKHDGTRMAEQTPDASSCQRPVGAGEYALRSREKRRTQQARGGGNDQVDLNVDKAASSRGDKHFRIAEGRDSQGVQEVPPANGSRLERGSKNGPSLPVDGEPLQRDGSKEHAFSRTVRRAVPESEHNNRGSGSISSQANEGGSGDVDQGNSKSKRGVLRNLPLLNLGLPQASFASGHAPAVDNFIGNCRQQVDDEIDRQTSGRTTFDLNTTGKHQVASGYDASAEEAARGISDTGTMKIDVPGGEHVFTKDIESFCQASLLQSSEALPHLITQQRHSGSRLNSLEDLQEQVGHKSSLTPALNTPQLLPVENISAQEIQQDKPVLICARSEEAEVARTSARVDVQHDDDFEIDDLGR
ncbi:MAG TPA: relaxase/mobilization nuclease domain-containing protein [Pyrinomonadaceae bacterium]